MTATPPRVVALAGGVGAARFLRGLVRAIDPAELTVVVNTGDDRDFFGLRVCPDLDIVTYTLSGVVRKDTGWGIEGDSENALRALRRFRDDVWFSLGDTDLATHIHRTERLARGIGLAAVTDEIARAFGLRCRLLPMTEDPARTIVVRTDGRRSDFEEYLVRDGAPDDVVSIDLGEASVARPAPGVLEALVQADVVLVCPSNPIVSIGTILAVPGVRDVLAERRDAVAVSPIIGGRPVKGPADRLLRAVGREVSARGVAEHYAGLVEAIVIDEEDRALAEPIESIGLRTAVTNTRMTDVDVAAALAHTTLALARGATSEVPR